MKKIILNLALAASLIICFGGCDKEEKKGACKAGQGSLHHGLASYNGVYVPWTNEIGDKSQVYYMHIGSNVQFFIAAKIANICTKSHVKVSYIAATNDITQPLPLKIFGEAFWSSYDDELILFTGTPQPRYGYGGDMEIGLKQAFGDGPGDIELFLTVEFPKQASLEEDINYFKKHISNVSINCYYDYAI